MHFPRLWIAVFALYALNVAAQMPTPDSSARLIVKFRLDGGKARLAPADRVKSLAAETGADIAFERPMAIGLMLLRVEGGSQEAAAAARALALRPDVESAEVDRRVHALRLPNDKYLSSLGYLNAGGASIDAFGAWDLTTGSTGTVIAVVDTGYRPHADLAGRVLPGYDFVSDAQIANDGDGRDADATDPGDWVTRTDKDAHLVAADCDITSSTWHGTGVAGIIAANADNAAWTAGIDWAAKILPVRVLGKCGGYTSDIIDGIAWAAGLPVPGVPMNPAPAQVINLSLGGEGACSYGESAVIAAALSTGRTRAIVAAAGNDSLDASNHSPSNCPGVIAVAAITSQGMLASYSDFGPAITIAAPGGDYDPFTGLEGILVLSNTGRSTPRSDTVRTEQGTSFAAPMVSGVVGLMLAVNRELTSAQVRTVLTSTAEPFKPGSDCNTTRCGAGTLDAKAAVNAARTVQAAGAAPTKDVVEFYNGALDHYFISAFDDEIASLDSGATSGWVRTGQSFKALSAPGPGTSPVCRFYLPPGRGDSHFFGRGPAECAQTRANHPDFIYEAPEVMDEYLPAAGQCPALTVPVYRVFSNRPDANHRYMVERTLRDQMVRRGWLAEGDGADFVVMCAPQ